MVRVLFWIVVAIGLGAFFFVGSRQKSMTDEENALFWGSVTVGIFFVIAFGTAFYLFLAYKKGVIARPSRFGPAIFFSRDSEPLKYWEWFFYWVIFMALFFISACFIGVHELLPMLSQHLANH